MDCKVKNEQALEKIFEEERTSTVEQSPAYNFLNLDT